MLFGRVKVRVNLRKCNRNIYLILGYVRQAMMKANKEKKYNQLWNEVMKTTKYNDDIPLIFHYLSALLFCVLRTKGESSGYSCIPIPMGARPVLS